MSQLTIPFKKTKVNVPVINFCVRDESEELCAIIDTGSESTIFDDKFLTDYSINTDDSQNMTLVSLSGEGGSVTIKQVNTHLFFGEDEQAIGVEGISADISGVQNHIRTKYKEKARIAVILGNDFLKRYRAKINYKTKEITLFYDLSGK